MDLADLSSTLSSMGLNSGYDSINLNDLYNNIYSNYSPMNPTTLNMSDLQPPSVLQQPIVQQPSVVPQQVQQVANNDGYSDAFNNSYDFTSKWEGGYSNHKHDKGGATNYGISTTFMQSLHPKESKAQIQARIDNLTQAEAKRIMHDEFWIKNKMEKIQNSDVAKFFFDTCVNHGQGFGAKALQTAVNNVTGAGLTVDGKIGEKTLKAVNSSNSRAILQEMVRLRGNKYNRIIENNPSQEDFRKGWFRRLNSLADSVKVNRYA